MTRLLTLLVAVLAINVSAFAQPLADRVPGDALLYVGWAGTQQLGEAYEKSHFKAVMRPDGGGGQFEAIARMVTPIIEREDPAMAPVVMQLGKVLDRMVKHPTALYVGPPVIGEDAPPMPRMALICKAGDDAAALRDEITQWMRDAEVPAPIQVEVIDGVLWLNVGVTPPADKASSLAGKAGFAASFKGLVAQPALAVHVDTVGIVALVDMAAETEMDEYAAAEWAKARDVLGLRGIKRVVWAGGFVDRDWETALFVEAPAPRKGIASLIDSKGPIAPESLKMIPATSSLAGGIRFDLDHFYGWLYETVGALEPNAKADLDEGMAQANEVLGFDLRADLLQGLGADWLYYADRSVAGTSPMGVVFVNRLRKPEARVAVERMILMGNALMIQQLAREEIKIKVNQFAHGDQSVYYLNTPLITPALTINDERLLVGLYPQTVTAAIDREGKPTRGIGEASQFVVLKQKMGVKQVGAFQYADLPQLVDQSYPGVLMMSRLFPGFLDMLGVDTPPLLVPPLNQLRPHLSPAVGFSWVDERGLHVKTRSPFPGASSFGTGLSVNQASVGTTALGLSILLPAINRARTLANRAVSGANLRNIGLGCFAYAQSNNGAFPDNLGVLVADGSVGIKNVVHPDNSKRPPAHMRAKDMGPWVVANTDYVYLGGHDSMPANTIIAYEKLGKKWSREGITILFADGSVRWTRMAEARMLLARQKAR